MKVFGSLDHETLNIGMDALERLHNQGRKVGVISHVMEMTECISVQIKVSKQQSGKNVVGKNEYPEKMDNTIAYVIGK